MRRGVLVLVCLWASVAGIAGPVPCEVRAADPPKVAAAEPATIDQLMKQLADLRAQKAEIEKREKATLAELKERLQLLRDLLKDLDLEPTPAEPDSKPDALTVEFQAAYAADPAADKAVSLAKLAAAMESAAATARDPVLVEFGQLESRVNRETVAAVGRGKLPAVGVVIGRHLSAALPQSGDPKTPLTPALRDTAAAAYSRVAKSLKAVKP